MRRLLLLGELGMGDMDKVEVGMGVLRVAMRHQGVDTAAEGTLPHGSLSWKSLTCARYGGFGGAPQGDAGPAPTSRYGGGAPATAPASRYGGGAPDAGQSRYGAAPAEPASRYGGGAPADPAGGQGGYGAPVGGRYGGTAAANGAEQDRAGASEWETGRGSVRRF